MRVRPLSGGAMERTATGVQSGLGCCMSALTVGYPPASWMTTRSRFPVGWEEASNRGVRRSNPIPITIAGAARMGASMRSGL